MVRSAALSGWSAVQSVSAFDALPRRASDLSMRKLRTRTPLGGLFSALIAAILVTSTSEAAQQSAQDSDSSRPTIGAHAVDNGPGIDGVLDEPEWADAEVAGDFTQREPDPGEPASESTEFRVIYTRSTLYIGVIAYDRRPDQLIADEMQRDSMLENDDSVSILLDTFHDHRNGFLFETNANGARSDALVEAEGSQPNRQWDGVWRVRSTRTTEGWIAEIAIPFSTLRFSAGNDTWGFNMRGLVRRRSEETFWSPIGLEANGTRVSLAGHITGLNNLQPGLNLRVKPFALGSSGRSFEAGAEDPGDDLTGGADMRWGVTQGLTLDMTYNTDFAQVEVDEQRVNLTRFSLFFPEKREFFLENAGIFEFGPPAGRSDFRPPFFKAFFSRRIGLENDERVPIDYGARLTGRVGGWNIGLLDVQTETTPLDEGEIVPSANWGVVRIKRNLGERSSIGAIFTNQQSDAGDWNRAAGVDFDVNPSARVNLNGFFIASQDPGQKLTDLSDNWAAGAGFVWRGSTWRANAEYQEIRENFNPEMGFLLREGVRRYNSNVDFEPRPQNNLGLRSLSFNLRSEIVTDTEGTLETVDTTVRLLGLQFRSGDRLTFFGSYNYEFLEEPFEIQDDLFIPQGEYESFDVGVFVTTDGGRPVSFFGFWTLGDFYTGKRTTGSSRVTTRINKHLNMATSWNHNNVDLPQGSFVTNVLQQRVNLALTPDLFFNTFAQINDADDLFAINARLNWIYKPGADLFLVYNQQWDTSGDAFTAINRAVIVKFTYLLIL